MIVWRYLRSDGQEMGTSEAFADREAAETWMAEHWSDLLESGIEDVELVDPASSAPVYRMPLRPDPL